MFIFEEMQTIKKYLKHFVLLLALLPSMGAKKVAHPFYLSVSELQIDSKAKTIHLSCRPFIDDIQFALHEKHQLPLNLTNVNEENKKLLEAYIQQCLQVKIGKQLVAFTCIGYEIEEEAVWCYFEASLSSNSKQIEVKNTLLCETLSEQINVMNCLLNGERQTIRMDCKKRSHIFTF